MRADPLQDRRIDIGGTFTNLVAVATAPEGTITDVFIEKSLRTPSDSAQGSDQS